MLPSGSSSISRMPFKDTLGPMITVEWPRLSTRVMETSPELFVEGALRIK